MGTRQPQLQRPPVPLEGVQLRAEVEGTLQGEEAKPPAMGYPLCHPPLPCHCTHLPLPGSVPQHLEWPLRLRHGERWHTGLWRMGVLRGMGEGTPKP